MRLSRGLRAWVLAVARVVGEAGLVAESQRNDSVRQEGYLIHALREGQLFCGLTRLAALVALADVALPHGMMLVWRATTVRGLEKEVSAWERGRHRARVQAGYWWLMAHRRRCVVARVLMRYTGMWAQQILARIWSVWCKVAVLGARVLKVAKRAARHWCSHVMSRGFQAWIGHYQTSVQARIRVQGALARWRAIQLSKALLAWHGQARAMRRQLRCIRLGYEMLSTILRVMEASAMPVAMALWRGLAQASSRARHSALRRWQHRSLRSARLTLQKVCTQATRLARAEKRVRWHWQARRVAWALRTWLATLLEGQRQNGVGIGVATDGMVPLRTRLVLAQTLAGHKQLGHLLDVGRHVASLRGLHTWRVQGLRQKAERSIEAIRGRLEHIEGV